MKNLIRFILPTLFLGLVFNACIKEDFDQPPTEGIDPGLTANTTIAELKAMHTFGQFDSIKSDIIIKGTVVADDKSGNFFETFVIQDETGGISVKIEGSDNYPLYPIGREVYIKCQDLIIADYNNLIQLGGFVIYDPQRGNSLGNILRDQDYIFRGKKVDPPLPKIKKASELTINDVNTLITVTDVQFQLADTSLSFAQQGSGVTANRYIEDCDGIELIVRTSSFANFAGVSLPNGGGSLTGILSVFRDDLQFLVRDINDVKMDGDRCSGGGGGGGGNPCTGGTVPTVDGIDEDFESGANNDPVDVTGWTNFNVKGTRTWQYKEFSGNIYAQATAFNDSSPEMDIWLVTPLINVTADASVLTFETATAFYTHDGFTASISTDFECDPTTATWVPLNATLAGASSTSNEWIASGDVDLTALIGQKVAIGFHYVGSGTSGQTGTFRVDNVKLGMGGGGTGGNDDPCQNGNPPLTVATLNEAFSTGVNNTDIALTGWTNLAETGTRRWQSKLFSGNTYVQATAFNDTNPEMAAWLVTPLLDITGPKVLSFETAKAFWTHDGLTVWISTDFNCDPLTATWEELSTALIAGMPNVDHEWIPSGDIDLSDYIGQKVAIGFKYVGNNSTGLTSSYRVDNVVVQ
ncbi:MAG: choice-of-anchor J domain-containing protein [Saprospiraceae bacterium]|nr:choice-of-anchor J domain-containing protein [Saprospiraceae bacterium]